MLRKLRRRLRGSPDTILLGPWLGELGHELMYWIPWLVRRCEKGVWAKKRLIVVSRGGTESWYTNVSHEYVEIYDYLSQQEFTHVQRGERKGQKQTFWTPGEEQLIDQVAKRLALEDYEVVHPSDMWTEVLQWFGGQRKMKWLMGILSYKEIPPTPKYSGLVDRLGLPDEFVFLRFYHGPQLPAVPENFAIIEEITNSVSAKRPVVTVGPAFQVDDHEPMGLSRFKGNVIDVAPHLEPATNLGVQTEILRRSMGYVGTSGSVAFLPALLGRPSLSFHRYDVIPKEIFHRHQTVAYNVFRQQNLTYQVLDVHGWRLMKDWGLVSSP